ncbi:MAG TPA: hypothetical protein VMU62_08765, partial [Acidobacteriaceae bacterium]|nr:hypothetical protein [Acidobacteriaceae bacterium]
SYNIDLDVKSQNGSASVKTPHLKPGNFELRAGSPHDQHIVSFDAASSTGTKFALVAVEFPHKNETN